MIAEQIRKLQHTVPFEPYTVFTADGKGLYVKHPDYCLITPGNDTLHIYETETVWEIVAARNITRVEPGARKSRPRKR